MKKNFYNFISFVFNFLKKKDCSHDFHELEFHKKSIRPEKIEEF